METTAVIFRTWRKSRTVIALFPFEPATSQGVYCMSYEHVGQHGAADPAIVNGATRKATPAEYEPLKRELESIGYSLEIRERFPRNAYDVRKRKAGYTSK